MTKEGRWECYSKYIKQNCFSYFLSLQCTNRCHLAMIALNDCHKAMVARRHLLVYWMWRKQQNQLSSMYLQYHSQPLPSHRKWYLCHKRWSWIMNGVDVLSRKARCPCNIQPPLGHNVVNYHHWAVPLTLTNIGTEHTRKPRAKSEQIFKFLGWSWSILTWHLLPASLIGLRLDSLKFYALLLVFVGQSSSSLSAVSQPSGSVIILPSGSVIFLPLVPVILFIFTNFPTFWDKGQQVQTTQTVIKKTLKLSRILLVA